MPEWVTDLRTPHGAKFMGAVEQLVVEASELAVTKLDGPITLVFVDRGGEIVTLEEPQRIRALPQADDDGVMQLRRIGRVRVENGPSGKIGAEARFFWSTKLELENAGDDQIVDFKPDAAWRKLWHLEVTMPVAEAVFSIELPDWARGIRMYPTNGNCRFAINEDPSALATANATPVLLAAWGSGGNVMQGMWETRLLEPGQGRTLRLRSSVAGLVMRLGVF